MSLAFIRPETKNIPPTITLEMISNILMKILFVDLILNTKVLPLYIDLGRLTLI